jgi:hypothetical protein
MDKALEKSDLPKSAYVVKKMADYMLLGLEQNIEVTPEDVLPLVREEVLGDIREMIGSMPKEVIESLFGKDVLNVIRKKNVSQAKDKPASINTIKDTGVAVAKKEEPKEKQSFREFFKLNR